MLPADRPARVGYVLKVYPRFSETFVVTEVLAREAAGEDLSIYALRPTTDARFHPEIARVQAPVTHLPKPVKLSESWAVLGAARAVLPEFDRRFADLLPFLTELDATEAVQGIELAINAHRDGITHLHAHFASMAARVARVAAGLAGISYSVTTHAKDLFHQGVNPALLRQVLGHADHVVAISEFNLDFIRARYPEVGEHTVLIRNGLELARFPYADPAPLAGPLKILAVGRLVEKKGFDQLVRAAARLTARGIAVDVRIAGDGELREELAAQVAAAGMRETVHLLGPRSQSEVRDLLGWADAMAAPCVVGADGNADGLPTVLLEAMASGLPVIGTDVTGIPEAVRNGSGDATDPGTGLLLPAGDEPALVEALRRVARPDFPRVAVARAARALIEERFDAARQSRLLGDRQQPAPALAG